jgi:hypothetical protein
VLIALLQFFVSAAIIVPSAMARTADSISRVTRMGQLLGDAILVTSATALAGLFVGVLPQLFAGLYAESWYTII